MVLVQPRTRWCWGGEDFARRADPPVQAVPAALPSVSTFPPAAALPPLAGTVPPSAPSGRLLDLPPLFGPVGPRRG
jgi:hypothetical protein